MYNGGEPGGHLEVATHALVALDSLDWPTCQLVSSLTMYVCSFRRYAKFRISAQISMTSFAGTCANFQKPC